MSVSPICSHHGSATIKRILHALLTVCALLPSIASSREDPSRIWIGRPWEFRYILQIDSPDDYEGWRSLGKKTISGRNFDTDHRPESVFPLTLSISTDPGHYREADKAIGAVLITFNEQGQVTSPYDWPHKLSGQLNRLYTLVLASGNGPEDIQFRLGHWYTGRSDSEHVYIPAICTLHDMNERYKKVYAADRLDVDGNFGCREWGYYLQNPEIPYIDVTSYGKDKSTYIRPVIGWGRFDVPPKPVIGKHGNVWVCLHECPNGEAPGIIPDIKAWAAKNGWPVPKRPKKMPLFPDKPRKPGAFID